MQEWPTPNERQWRDSLAGFAHKYLPPGLDTAAGVLTPTPATVPPGTVLTNARCESR